MAVYVDELFDTEKTPRWRYAKACHLTADTLEELHEFAERIGMKKQWFQNHPRHPHYDLTVGRRRTAVRLGAVEVKAREKAEAERTRRLMEALDRDDLVPSVGPENTIPGMAWAFSTAQAIDIMRKRGLSR
ncbi:MAG: DUF4031 domain-containing protein [Candidatus Paceibacterota bacterium]|jgi:hypothetical protein